MNIMKKLGLGSLAVAAATVSTSAMAADYDWSGVSTQIASTVGGLTAIIGSVGMALISVSAVILGFKYLVGFVRSGR